MTNILDAEAGVCSGRSDQHHPLCIVNEPNHKPHLVDVRVRRRRMSCKDISDDDFMTAVETVCLMQGRWALRWEVAAVLAGRVEDVGNGVIEDYDNMPWKLVVAKARKLIRRGVLSGCYCGCRGDFELMQLSKE